MSSVEVSWHDGVVRELLMQVYDGVVNAPMWRSPAARFEIAPSEMDSPPSCCCGGLLASRMKGAELVDGCLIQEDNPTDEHDEEPVDTLWRDTQKFFLQECSTSGVSGVEPITSIHVGASRCVPGVMINEEGKDSDRQFSYWSCVCSLKVDSSTFYVALHIDDRACHPVNPDVGNSASQQIPRAMRGSVCLNNTCFFSFVAPEEESNSTGSEHCFAIIEPSEVMSTPGLPSAMPIDTEDEHPRRFMFESVVSMLKNDTFLTALHAGAGRDFDCGAMMLNSALLAQLTEIAEKQQGDSEEEE